jgi:hypothetical protein
MPHSDGARPVVASNPNASAIDSDFARQLRRGRLRVPVAIGAGMAAFLAVLIWLSQPLDVAAIERRGGFRFRDGDLLFVSCDGPLCHVIEGVTQSPFSHVGMVSGTGADATVIEAFGPVGEVPLQVFLERSSGNFTLMRWVGEPATRISDIEAAMRSFAGRPYDSHYQLDDERIYCSELVYKAVLKVTGIEAAPLRKLGDMNYAPYEDFIRRKEGTLPLERQMITPADLQRSPFLLLIHSTIDGMR